MPQQSSYSDRHRSIWRRARTRYCCGAKPTQIRPRVLCGDELEDRKSQACRRVSSCDLLADVTVVFTLAKRKTLSAHPTPSPFSWTLNVTTDFFAKVFATVVINFSPSLSRSTEDSLSGPRSINNSAVIHTSRVRMRCRGIAYTQLSLGTKVISLLIVIIHEKRFRPTNSVEEKGKKAVSGNRLQQERNFIIKLLPSFRSKLSLSDYLF